MFKNHQRVVKIIDVHGSRSATVQTIETVSENVASIVDSSLKFDARSGTEIDPAFPADSGISSHIVAFDDGEIERLGL